MIVSYSLYFNEPPSRNLDEKVDPEDVEWRRLEDLHKIHNLMESMVEDLAELLPAGYSVELSKEETL